jgi:hypothetical protein
MRLPAFVIAGQPNEGKTTVVATLTEDEKARIGPIPGTTRELKTYTVKVDGEPKLILYDTPGFENPGELLEWFRTHASRHENPAEAFLAVADHRQDYPFDCEILKPIAERAAVIHVVNPGREPRPEDAFEAEIFRLCKVPRIGVMNRRSDGTDHREKWVRLMSSEMNTWREFNACKATFADRLELLEAFTIVVPEWDRQMKDVTRLLSEQWSARLSATALVIIQTLRDAVIIDVSEVCESHDQEKVAKERAAARVRSMVVDLEHGFRSKVRETYHHGKDHWTPGDNLEFDLFDKKAWQIMGFSKKAVVAASIVAGSGVGTWVDIATGGGTIGIGALVGGAVGGVSAYLSANKAVRIILPGMRLGPLRFPGVKLGGVSLKAGIERKSKLPSVLLDRMFCYATAAARWSHGRRAETAGSSPDDRAGSFCHALENPQEEQSDEKDKNERGTKAVARLQSLIELWHVSRENTLGAKKERIVQESEVWLQNQLIEHLRRATCVKHHGTS